MQLTSEQKLPVDVPTAWAALNDVDLLKRSIPGCESLVATGEGAFEALVVAAIGPVKAKFKGRMQLDDLDPPHAYTIRFDGQGGAAGFGKGSARVELAPDAEAEGVCTVLKYSATASVGGKIAQVGSRLVDMAAQKMAEQFFENFRAALAENEAVRASAATAPAAADDADEPGGLMLPGVPVDLGAASSGPAAGSGAAVVELVRPTRTAGDAEGSDDTASTPGHIGMGSAGASPGMARNTRPSMSAQATPGRPAGGAAGASAGSASGTRAGDTDATAAGASWLGRLGAWFRRLFGGR